VAGHSTGICHGKSEYRLVSPKLQAIAVENIGSFSSFQVPFVAAQGEPSNNSQSVSKKSNSEVSKLHFTAEQSSWPKFYFGIIGCAVLSAGVFIFGFSGSSGLVIMLCGACILFFYASATLG
jgi:hypothetical protein